MGTPSAVFPVAVATDAQLKVANNLIQTTLRVGVDAVNTILFVNSTAGFVANSLVSIDKEIMSISGVVSTPDPQLIVASGGRGFDGTVVAAHAAGAKVSMFIDAWHHNALSSEIKAIEGFIGPNGQNLNAASAARFRYALDYQFSQSPGGTLAAGVIGTVTLSPVPKGVNGSDQKHYVYLSGGTGAPEAVLIQGGSAVSGAASGTLMFTPANAHSGAWTISTATGGIAEAIVGHTPNTGGVGACVILSPGTFPVYAPIEVSGLHGLTIYGAGIGSAIIDIADPATDLFLSRAELRDLDLGGFSVTSSVGRTAGWVFHGNIAYNASGLLRRSRFRQIDIKKQVNGFWIAQFELSQMAGCWMTDFVGSGGIAVKCGQTSAASLNQGSSLFLTDIYIYGRDFVGSDPIRLAYGLWIEDCDAVEVNHAEIADTLIGNVHITSTGYGSGNHFFNELVSDSCGSGPGFYITGFNTTDVLIDGSWFCSAGKITNTPDSPGIKIDAATANAIQIRNSVFAQNLGNAIRIDMPAGSALMLIAGNMFVQNALSGTAGSADTIYINVPNNGLSPFLIGNQDAGSSGGGFSLRTVNSNLVQVGDNHFASGISFANAPRGLRISGTSAVLGGSAMTAGQSISTTTTVAGAVVNMVIATTPQTFPGNGFVWQSYVSAANSVVTVLTCLTAGTPAASAYILQLLFPF